MERRDGSTKMPRIVPRAQPGLRGVRVGTDIISEGISFVVGA